jgi:hypothetical protein
VAGLRALFKNRAVVNARLVLLGSVALLAAGCGSGSKQAAPTTTTAPAPTTMPVTVFLVDQGMLRPRVQHVPRTQAVAGAALAALGVTAPVTVSGGTATVALDKASNGLVAEIVYTLTQFSSVERVDVAGRTGLTRDDFAAYVPPILVESPAAGAAVPRTFHVSGTASVFEATLVVQLVRDGTVLSKQTVTASEGAPGRGTFDATFTATPGALTVAAFSPSAADGSPQHEVDVAVTVTP